MNQSNFRTLFLFIILIASACIANAAVVKISFNVTDSDTGMPLDFAAVTLSAEGNAKLIGGNTDTKGHYTATVAPGKWRVDVSLVGYRPSRKYITVTTSEKINIALQPDEPLSEVIVTARESHNSTSASVIDTTAMKHLQPSSFSDLMELLPGNITKDPDMGSVNAIALRQATNITTTDDYSTAALGTSFVIDGVPVNTNAGMQSTPDANQSARSTIGKGVDMRAISTDDIESVEIVRGIPSVEYGELTSGLVKIKRKNSASRWEARFKADTQSQLFYIGKGLQLDPTWILNVGADYLDSKIDPRNNRENFKRINASVRSDKRWDNTSHRIGWNSSVNYAATIERDYNDPDLTVNNTIDSYRNNRSSVTWNNAFTYRPIVLKYFREFSFTSGISYSYEHLKQQKHVAPSRVMPLPVSTQPGSNYVGYLPMLYLADYDVFGKPFTAFVKASSRFRAETGNLSNETKAGVEWNMSKNYGKGAVYDLTRPLTTSTNSRPRAYNDIPAMHQLSAYIENNTTIHAGNHTIGVIIGLRETQLLNLDSKYTLSGKPYFDPRVTATWSLPATYLKDSPITWELAGGFGWHTKMPVAAYLYPNKLYSDFEQLNYYHNEKEYRTMNVMTYVEDITNYHLKAARNFKWEVRGDVSYRGNRLSLTFFKEDMKNGFRNSGTIHRYHYNAYDASGFDPYLENRAPTIEELPYTVMTYQTTKSQITNGSRTRKEGVEYTFQSRRIPSIHTRVTVSGAYFKTINNNSQDLWYKPTIIANNRELQYIGLYDDEDGSIYRSFNTNIMFDTDIPSLNLNISLTAQNMWFTSRQTLWRDGIPTHYLDPDGNLHPYTQEDMADPYLRQLVRNFASGSFEKITVPAATTFNLKATKSFWNNRIGLALYVNRLLAIEPDYKRYGMTIRRYSSPYFGMELNLKL